MSSVVNVLVLLSQLPDTGDQPGGVRARQLLRALRAAGMRAHVVAFRGPGQGEADEDACRGLAGAVTVFGRPFIGPVSGALSLMFRGDSYAVPRHGDPAVHAQIQNILKADKFDATICCGVAMTQYVPRKQVPFYMLDLATPESAVLAARARAAGALSRWCMDLESTQVQHIEQRQSELAELITVSSELEAQSVARRCQRRQVLAVPNGVTPGERPGRAGIVSAAPRILMRADFDHEAFAPAVKHFIEQIWPAARRVQPMAELAIVAHGAPHWLRAAATPANHIEVIEGLDHLGSQMRRALFAVAPWSEPRGMPLLMPQALASGVPIVAHVASVAGIAEPLRRHITVAQTPQQWVDAIDRLVRDRAHTYDMASRGYEAAALHATAEAVWKPVMQLLLAATTGTDRVTQSRGMKSSKVEAQRAGHAS